MNTAAIMTAVKKLSKNFDGLVPVTAVREALAAKHGADRVDMGLRLLAGEFKVDLKTADNHTAFGAANCIVVTRGDVTYHYGFVVVR